MPANIDLTMLEMFRTEVETHMAVLNDGLLSLEKDPSRTDCCEALMRAAHSIKGAAKIVGIPAAVAVAHAIEDSFVAARAGRVQITSALVDVLLAGVDLLGRAAEVDGAGRAALDADDPQVADTTARIAAAMRAAPIVAPAAADAGTGSGHRGEPLSIRPRGSLDVTWAAANRDQLVARLRNEPASVLFDLTEVTSIDAAGLALLSLAARLPSPAGATGGIRIEGVSASLLQLLHAAGLGDHCRVARAGA
jgi:two-component system sensor histidine kinase and response regulator WspE